MPLPSKWTQEIEDATRTMWLDEGKSAAVIANQLLYRFQIRITRSAVIGKCHREGWHRFRKSPRIKSRIVRGKTMTKAKWFPSPARRHGSPMEAIGGNSASRASRASLPKKPLIHSIEKLNGTTCRFPYGDPGEALFGWCGRKCAETSSYCESHHQFTHA